MVDTPPPCEYIISLEHGICGRLQGHPIHMPHGLSPFEHKYKAPEGEQEGRIYEVTVLSKRNLKDVAKRSGKDVEELDAIRRVQRRKGRVPKVKYALAPGIEPRTVEATITEAVVNELGEE